MAGSTAWPTASPASASASTTRTHVRSRIASFRCGASARIKHHPHFRVLLAGGTRRAHGARPHRWQPSAFSQAGRPGRGVGCMCSHCRQYRAQGMRNAMQRGMLAAEATFAALAQFVSTASPGTLRVPTCVEFLILFFLFSQPNSTAEKSHQTGAEKEANIQAPAEPSLFLAFTPLPSPTHPRPPTFGPGVTCAPRSTGAGAVSSMQGSMVLWTLKNDVKSGVRVVPSRLPHNLR
ncbi:hypothetical protein K438DRAFT_193373 [Mycena galopus ATCC 62051]|nr:hypothetical protein K438DRAFT_193373 [Mycena galopus ATCC 62051]